MRPSKTSRSSPRTQPAPTPKFEETWVGDHELSDQAQNNSIENFKLAFDRKFMQTIVTRMDDNSEIFKKILDDDEFSDFVRERPENCVGGVDG